MIGTTIVHSLWFLYVLVSHDDYYFITTLTPLLSIFANGMKISCFTLTSSTSVSNSSSLNRRRIVLMTNRISDRARLSGQHAVS